MNDEQKAVAAAAATDGGLTEPVADVTPPGDAESGPLDMNIHPIGQRAAAFNIHPIGGADSSD